MDGRSAGATAAAVAGMSGIGDTQIMMWLGGGGGGAAAGAAGGSAGNGGGDQEGDAVELDMLDVGQYSPALFL